MKRTSLVLALLILVTTPVVTFAADPDWKK
jgi:hypothetical protein